MPQRVFPRDVVRVLFLHRQHLGRPRAHGLTPRRVTRFAEDAGRIRMDSINVLERAHHLAVWSRFGPYDWARLDRLVYCRRLFLEYWAHAACLVPVSMLPWWKRARLDYRVRHTGWSAGCAREHPPARHRDRHDPGRRPPRSRGGAQRASTGRRSRRSRPQGPEQWLAADLESLPLGGISDRHGKARGDRLHAQHCQGAAQIDEVH